VLECALQVSVEGVQPVQSYRLGAGKALMGGRLGAMVGHHTVLQRETALGAERRRDVAGEEAQAKLYVSQHAALLGAADLSSVGELASLTQVVDNRRAHEQVPVQARMHVAQLQRHRRHRHGVLEQAAEISVMAREASRSAEGSSARGPVQLAAQLAILKQALQKGPQPGVIDLPRQMLEETLKLVEIAVADGQELRRVGTGALGARDLVQGDLKLLAEALHAPAYPHKIAALETSPEHVRVTKGPSHDRSRPVAQLYGQIGGSGAGDLALLAHAGEDPVHVLAGAQGRDVRSLLRRGPESWSPARWDLAE
jgi:hypothetical protein